MPGSRTLPKAAERSLRLGKAGDEIKAAQYVRMSTGMQRYSIENQSEAIAVYAAHRGLTIVRSYEDAARSGLHLDGREALKNLLDDVRLGRADFKVILVYDVSRWGRFQDSDESAYYEFICKDAGISVEYCAEQFDNDGSLTATILKNIKRAMAGEYSRELSVKVFAGQSRIAAMGFNVGSSGGYGLRRMLVDEDGNPKMLLARGQRKSRSQNYNESDRPCHGRPSIRLLVASVTWTGVGNSGLYQWPGSSRAI